MLSYKTYVFLQTYVLVEFARLMETDATGYVIKIFFNVYWKYRAFSFVPEFCSNKGVLISFYFPVFFNAIHITHTLSHTNTHKTQKNTNEYIKTN